MGDMAFHLLLVALPLLLVGSDAVSDGHPSTTIQDFTPGTSPAVSLCDVFLSDHCLDLLIVY